MRTLAMVVVTMTMAGCAGTRSGVDGAPTTQTVAIGRGASAANDVTVTTEAFVKTFEVPAGRDRLFDLFPDAFDQVGLPAPLLNRSTYTAAVRDHTVQRRLGGQRLSRMFECGTGPTGAYADTRRIEMDVTVRLQPAAEGTSVTTDIGAHSYDPTGRTAITNCTSRGLLERMIADALRSAAAG